MEPPLPAAPEKAKAQLGRSRPTCSERSYTASTAVGSGAEPQSAAAPGHARAHAPADTALLLPPPVRCRRGAAATTGQSAVSVGPWADDAKVKTSTRRQVTCGRVAHPPTTGTLPPYQDRGCHSAARTRTNAGHLGAFNLLIQMDLCGQRPLRPAPPTLGSAWARRLLVMWCLQCPWWIFRWLSAPARRPWSIITPQGALLLL